MEMESSTETSFTSLDAGLTTDKVGTTENGHTTVDEITTASKTTQAGLTTEKVGSSERRQTTVGGNHHCLGDNTCWCYNKE